MFSMTQTYPACPYCQCAKSTMGYGDYDCPRCGANFTVGLAITLNRLKPEIRAERIGDYHARNNWAYLWFTRSSRGMS